MHIYSFYYSISHLTCSCAWPDLGARSPGWRGRACRDTPAPRNQAGLTVAAPETRTHAQGSKTCIYFTMLYHTAHTSPNHSKHSNCCQEQLDGCRNLCFL